MEGSFQDFVKEENPLDKEKENPVQLEIQKQDRRAESSKGPGPPVEDLSTVPQHPLEELVFRMQVTDTCRESPPKPSPELES